MSDNQANKQSEQEKSVTLAEDYQLLLAGRRLKSSRSATVTVSEREKKLQIEQMQQSIARKREKQKKKGKKPGKPLPPMAQQGKPGRPPSQQAQSTRRELKQKPSFSPDHFEVPQMCSTPVETFQDPKPRSTFQSPYKPKHVVKGSDKDIFEQLSEFQVLNKVLPQLDRCEGIFVQTQSKHFGQVISSSDSGTLKVRVKQETTTEDLNQTKFLCGSYWCQISDIDFSRVNDRFAQDFEIRSRDQDSPKCIVLIQTVSQGQDSVVHRLHALIDEGNSFNLHPTSFKNNPKLQKQKISADLKDEEMVEWWYKNDAVDKVLNFAKKIQRNFNDYRAKIEKVRLDDKNCDKLIFSVCHVYEPERQVGILTRVHNGQAFLRLFRQKAEDTCQQKWFDIQEVGIFADLTLGFVSQQTLYSSQVFDMKIRKITFTSKREAQLAPQQSHSEANCKQCSYPKVDRYKVKVCSRCQFFLHEECLKPFQLKQGTEDKWLCPQCIRCYSCKACSNNIQVCGQCNAGVHIDCIDLPFSRAIQTTQLQELGKPKPGFESEFRCETCIKCTACSRQTPGDAPDSQWSADFKLCASCDKKRDQKLFCGGCLKFLPEDSDKSDMLKCASCSMWIHNACDRMLEDPQVLAKFNDTILYACVSCRQKSRANFIEQIVDLMIQEDKKNEFLYPFWLNPPNQAYLIMIKEPICFQTIKDQLKSFEPNFGSQKSNKDLKYLSKPELLKQDIDRIFRNAKTFNPMQSEIHKLALRMHEKCNQILNQGRIWEIFEIMSKVTIDELSKLKQLRSYEDPVYQMKPKDLFCQHEQVDIRQYQFCLQQQEKAQLGKRSRELQSQQQQSKRVKLDENRESQIEVQQPDPVSPSDHKRIMHEANRRLLLQNLGNLLQNLQNKQLNNQKFPQHDFDGSEQQLSPKSKWQALMNDLRTSDERDSCWYSNPVRVSFDDPTLIFEEMCYLCGAFGLKEDFLGCNFCGESFHPYCLPCPKESKQGLQDHWFCYNCIFCEKCHSSRNWEFLVLCSVCDKADHFQCLEPQLIQVPECSWKCPDCFKCRTCGTNDFFSQEDIFNKVNLDPNEKYILSFDFEFCYQCGQDQYRKSFCNMCKQKTGLGLEPLQVPKKNFYAQVPLTQVDQCESIQLYKCVKCKFYSHLECSRTSLQSLKSLGDNFEGFYCLDCLLQDKQPGYYLHEQCKLYEDLHDRVIAFQTLKVLCSQLLSKYTNDELVLHEYVKQNQTLLESDPLVQKWLQLLGTEVDNQSETGTQEEVSGDALMKMTEVDEFTTLALPAATQQPREMYVCLYLKSIKPFQEVGPIPSLAFSENWLKPNQIDFSELFATIEYRAICKIRQHFFSWVEHKLVGPAIEHAKLFTDPQPAAIIAAAPQVEVANVTMEEVPDSAPSQIELCEEPDVMIQNPQSKLTCILCQQSGEKRITGRLIPFQVNQFVHVNCAMWTSEVQEGTEDTVISSELYNFFFAFKHFRHNKCSICDLKGATLICANHSVNRKCQSPYYHFPCAYQSGTVSFQNSCEIFCAQCTKREKNVHCGLPIKFKDYHRRRVLIVKNLQPQCTTAFNSIGGQNMPEPEQEQGKMSSAPYIVDCNKWRPFYYDMFNRAGNLTILSLSQSANTVIQSLHNISHQQTTWHQRFKKRDEQEKHSEFASLRIFWKEGSREKGYYLFTDNQVKIIEKPQVSLILEYVQKLMRTRISHVPAQQTLNQVAIQDFWQMQIQYLRQRYQNFSQDSTYLTPQLLCGLEKYPIQFWNNPQEQVKLPLKDMSVVNFFYKSADRVIKIQQLYTQKSQLEPQIPQSEPTTQSGGLHHIFTTMLKANKYVNQDGFTCEEVQNLKNPKFQTSTFSEMNIKQQLGSLDKSQPVLNQLSSRNMSYEQIMGCLGKKTIRQRKAIRQAQTNLPSDSDDEAQAKGKDTQAAEGEKPAELALKGNEINLAMRYRAARDRPRAVEVCTSKIHRNGLFACQSFNQKDVVIEYVGEKIRVPVADKREKYYEELGVGDCYFFTLDDTHIIDATFWGNKARYINHSCDPNLKSDKLTVNGETHIIFMANRFIESGEELTFDYQFEYEDEKLECFCDSAKCKGRLN